MTIPVNNLSFDIINVHSDQPNWFVIKFDNNIITTKKIITSQETISIEFSNIPGNHVLEMGLLTVADSKAGIAIGNFKINQFECVDRWLFDEFKSSTNFDGVLLGTTKITLDITTPILQWLNKVKVY